MTTGSICKYKTYYSMQKYHARIMIYKLNYCNKIAL